MYSSTCRPVLQHPNKVWAAQLHWVRSWDRRLLHTRQTLCGHSRSTFRTSETFCGRTVPADMGQECSLLLCWQFTRRPTEGVWKAQRFSHWRKIHWLSSEWTSWNKLHLLKIWWSFVHLDIHFLPSQSEHLFINWSNTCATGAEFTVCQCIP